MRKYVALALTLCTSELAVVSEAFAQEASDHVLVHYDFEGDDIETGPYTLSIFEGAKGTVSLSSNFRYGGSRSVEIRDQPGDGEFAELQGFFTDKWSGMLYVHFAILVAEPKETLNVAFAGIAHFSMQEHGLAIWFKTKSGVLHQVSAGQEEALFEVEPFTWYVLDVAYDVDRGRYDLTVSAEGRDQPVVALRDQSNVLGIPGSQLRKYSFIGDVPGRDRSKAWFYVDDIVILNDVPVSESPFVAPGRRMLFVDIYNQYQKRLQERPGCVPALGYEDFDLSPADLAELGAAGLENLLSSALQNREMSLPSTLSPFLASRLSAIGDWSAGCRGGDDALDRFRRASRAVPEAKIYPMSEVLALAAREEWRRADELFLSIYSLWQDDPRFPAIAASIGVARGDLEEAERWLSSSAEVVPERLRDPLVRKLWSGEIEPGLIGALQAQFPADWPDLVRTALSAELRFYVLLWQARYQDARAYAERMAGLFQRMELPAARWLERQADAAFYDGDYLEARARYEKSLEGRGDDAETVYLKLSDTHFMLGDLDLERRYREKIYGSLRPE
jgi:tetratricopeptide (TPR) repeat protein